MSSLFYFGKNLAKLRKNRQLTQLEFANLLEVQPRMVGRWEQGIAKPKFDYIIKLAHILEVSLDQLLLGDGHHTHADFEIKNKKLQELCKQVDHLKREDQEVICHFLNLAISQDKFKQIMEHTF